MKLLTTSLSMLIIGIVLGNLYRDQLGVFLNLSDQAIDVSAEAKPLYWVAPMDKSYRRDEPGQSPMGMDLVPVYEEGSSTEEGTIKISPTVENNLGVKTARVVKSSLVMPIETVGTVQFNESNIAHIHSRVEGWIEVLNVIAAGDPVRKGQTLYELYSPALVNAQEEYLAVLRSGNKNLTKASVSRLMSLGLDEQQIQQLKQRGKVNQRVKVFSPQDGFVIDLKVRQGMYIKPATEIVSIGSLDSVWVLGEVFERQSYLVKTGQDVEIQLNAMPRKTWKGTLNYIYPQLDPTTRTLKIRVHISNTDHFLKPNMLANLRVLNESEGVSLSIPQQALIKGSNHTRVVKALGEGRYQSVLVEAGFEAEIPRDDTKLLGDVKYGPRIQIIKGLTEGERIVTSAQFLIDSESNLGAEVERMGAGEGRSKSVEKDENDLANTVSTRGTVNDIMPGKVTLTHEPIPEWDWPAMRMDFKTSEKIDLSKIVVGQEINVILMMDDNHNYQIKALLED